ncbi:type II toxin-antitoxin system VapC family toxin [Streptomyces sp. NBS 14/10]|uniref:type II toxin-antitoxin system VapC family toxin n=1 Tax=Streptomyces sp. NBS 14/10 TaxID=1945643 RepID=UPI000B7E5FBB|nr:type II toxin-antitoxin system VapC family toxin [Streptomyces sp. NBS 14/10]KAK1177830.1 type II toxin-antitoxin system VapC family toxin [Streptomyces sp. NBS 14/10]
MSSVPTLVDSCVLLDMLGDDPKWAEWSVEKIAEAIDGGAVINPLIYTEVSIQYTRREDLDAAIPAEDYAREALPWEAGFLAGKAFLKYRRAGGVRTAPLPDFYIGAHSAVKGYRLLTRNRKDFRSYFPKLEIISPDE